MGEQFSKAPALPSSELPSPGLERRGNRALPPRGGGEGAETLAKLRKREVASAEARAGQSALGEKIYSLVLYQA